MQNYNWVAWLPGKIHLIHRPLCTRPTCAYNIEMVGRACGTQYAAKFSSQRSNTVLS